jgi:hypothetical protein
MLFFVELQSHKDNIEKLQEKNKSRYEQTEKGRFEQISGYLEQK